MRGNLVTELETLAAGLVRRRWVARAAVVSDDGEVLALCSARTPSRVEESGSDAPEAEAVPRTEMVARIAVLPVDEQLWIYADIGLFKLMALLSREQNAGAATTWLTGELQRLGLTVERETTAQD